MTPDRRWQLRPLQWLTQCLLCLGLAGATASACASTFVSYDFSSNDAGIPIAGTLSFSADMPIIDRELYWVSYQPSAVVSLSIGLQTWSNATTPNGYCDVWFHVGWIQVSVWCKSDGQIALLGDNRFRIDFFSDHGSNTSWDPDPTGPFTPENLQDLAVRGRLIDWSSSGSWGSSLRLDAVRIASFVDEPDLPTLLAAAAAGWLIARRWLPGHRVRKPPRAVN